MAEDDKFISRWAKRKAESRAGTPAKDAAPPVAAEADVQTAALSDAEGEAAEVADDHPAAGIDIDTLNADSDFSVFMHEKVPQAIRRRALRKLWLSDPIYAGLDGLNDYDEDFTDAALVVEGLKAAYDKAVERMKEREAAEAEAESEAGSDAETQSEDETLGEEPTAEENEGGQALVEAEDEDLEDGTDEA